MSEENNISQDVAATQESEKPKRKTKKLSIVVEKETEAKKDESNEVTIKSKKADDSDESNNKTTSRTEREDKPRVKHMRKRKKPNDDEPILDDSELDNGSDADENLPTIFIKELKLKPLPELFALANELGIDNGSTMPKQQLIFMMLKRMSKTQSKIVAEGVLEVLNDGYGFLRSSDAAYKAGPDDVYVPPNIINRFSLKSGDTVEGAVRNPRNNEKYFALTRVNTINGVSLEDAKRRINFQNLIPLYPDSRIKMELGDNSTDNKSARIIDLVAPIGKGQRALIVAPPKSGKTVLMQNIAKSIETNHPECELIVLLIDERPEEVTDMQRRVKGEVVSSTFDEPASRHVQLADMVVDKARRMVEHGKDVVILLDSITRLARAYNNVAPSSGKVLTGGVDANALQRPKRFFGAARNTENGGSLTIIATALIETGSRMDEVIFEEFKGTGNSEIILDRKLSDKRIFPAIDVLKSGTRHEEKLYDNNDMQKMWVLRKILGTMSNTEAMEFLISKLRLTKDNNEFFQTMNK